MEVKNAIASSSRSTLDSHDTGGQGDLASSRESELAIRRITAGSPAFKADLREATLAIAVNEDARNGEGQSQSRLLPVDSDHELESDTDVEEDEEACESFTRNVHDSTYER